MRIEGMKNQFTPTMVSRLPTMAASNRSMIGVYQKALKAANMKKKIGYYKKKAMEKFLVERQG